MLVKCYSVYFFSPLGNKFDLYNLNSGWMVLHLDISRFKSLKKKKNKRC